MIKYLLAGILVILITYILLSKWPTVDEKNKKKLALRYY